MQRRLAGALLAGLLVAAAGAYGLGVADLDGPGEERPTVTIRDADGDRLATVSVRVADTSLERYEGLSGTDPLADGEGMLFVHPEAGTYSYVMREMNYPLDIVFVAAGGEITTVHHAELPPAGTANRNLTRYTGRGKYVLELPYGYTNRTGVEAGDRVVVPRQYR